MNNKTKSCALLLLLFILAGLSACRKDDTPTPGDKLPNQTEQGLYLLCQGTFGSSNAAIDYYDFEKDSMYLNVFNKANPEIVKGLGDVGNDLGIYGSKMYIIVNNSNKIEIVNAHSVKRIKKIDFPQGRYITFYDGKAYATSSKGYVAIIDTASLAIIDTIQVGSNPEQLAVANQKLYVANSGGFNFPHYDSTLSVIDLQTNEEIKKIDVGINLTNVVANEAGALYAISKGNYGSIASNIYSIDTKADTVVKAFNIPATNMTIYKNKLYVYQYAFNYSTNESTKGYSLINTQTNEVINQHFLSKDAAQQIQIPFGINIQPNNEHIYISAAKDYTSPGNLYHLDQDGNLIWKVKTDVNPSKVVFLFQ